MGLDRRDRERELVSRLLAELHPGTLTDDAVGGVRGAYRRAIAFFRALAACWSRAEGVLRHATH